MNKAVSHCRCNRHQRFLCLLCTSMEQIIQLNVGGVYYMTRASTLTQSNSFFAGLLAAHPDCYELFVDRDPTHFRHVLNWMRGVRYLPDDESTLQELCWEADFYCLHEMREAIMKTKNRFSVPRILDGLRGEVRQLGASGPL